MGYYISIKHAKKFLDSGLVSEDDFVNFRQKMLAKYSPIIGGLAA
ncbi:SHOCT domain-containing protein [Streptococcus suis]